MEGRNVAHHSSSHHTSHQTHKIVISAIGVLLPSLPTHTQVATINNLHNIMLRLASVLALAVAGGIPSVVAFSPMIRAAKIAGGQTTSLNYYPDETSLMNPNYQQQGGVGGGGFPDTQHDISLAYDRALDCANNFGMCDIDELLDLSEGKFASREACSTPHK